jgi:MFS transporter, DHA2 family, multidrug resistance protein
MISFRILQGVFGASLIPISQYILRDTFSRAEQGKAMAIWGIGIMTGPILGPTLGGYITEALNWRWIFYINVPICLIALTMTKNFIEETPRQPANIDWLGLILLLLGIGCLQVFLDRGSFDGWFSSPFILNLAVCSAFSLSWFVYRGWKKKNNIINLQLFSERHFLFSCLIASFYSLVTFTVIILQPLMLENLLNYPPNLAGEIMAPRGLASAVGMILVSRVNKYVDNRVLIFVGTLLSAWSTYQMTCFNLSNSFMDYAAPGILQGLGIGIVMVRLSSYAFDYLNKKYIAEAAGLFSFWRSIGFSAGIAIFITLLNHQTSVRWQGLRDNISLANPNFMHWAGNPHLKNVNHALTVARQQAEQQSSMLGFIDAYWAATILMLTLLPLLLLLKKKKI